MFTKWYFLVECLQDQVVLFWSNGHIYITSIYILVSRWTCIVTFYHNMFAGTSPWHLFTPTSPWLLVGHLPFLLVTRSICWVCCWCDCQLQSVTGRTFSYRRGRVSGDWHWPSLSIYIQRVPQVRWRISFWRLWWKLKNYSRVDSEYQVFCATMNWVNHDISNRRRWVTFKKSSERCQIVKLWFIHYSSG